MENRAYALTAGLFTIVLFFAAIIVSVWLNRDHVERVPYLLATTRSVSGLSPQAPIRFRGLEVGRVKSVAFDPKVPGQVLVEMNIDPNAPLTTTTYATLGFQGVTGISFIQLNDDSTTPVRLSSSKDKIARIELRPSIFDKLETHGSLILTRGEELTGRLNDFLTPENQTRIFTMFEQMTKTAKTYESLPEQLAPSVAQLPALMADTRQTLSAVTKFTQDSKVLADNMNGLMAKIQAPDGALQTATQTLQQATTAINAAQTLVGEMEAQTLPRVNTLTDEARGSVRNLNRTLNTFSEQPQSILFGAPVIAPGPGEPGFAAPQPGR
jgi:phospholipid/cholesterol/gamma-HCH transport system substrate-binding protein